MIAPTSVSRVAPTAKAYRTDWRQRERTDREAASHRPASVAYHPLQSNLKLHLRHLMQPFTLARSCDSPQRGQVVPSSSAGRGGGVGRRVSTPRLSAIYPKNRYMKNVPPKHAEYKRDVIDKQVALMQERGIWKKSS